MCTYAKKPSVIESNEPRKLGTDALTDGQNIFINEKLNGWEEYFAIAHEYYHLQKMQKMLKSENYLPRGVKVKNDPNEEKEANEFAIKNYNYVQNLALNHINDREDAIKPKGEVWPLRINLDSLFGLRKPNSLDMFEILTGGEHLRITPQTVGQNATEQEKEVLRNDKRLKNSGTSLMLLKIAVRVWNESNELRETEDIVFEGHGYRGDLEKPYSEENKVVNMQGYMTPENIAQIVTMISKPEDWHGRILLIGCYTADLVDNVFKCLSNKFLVMGLNGELSTSANINGVLAGFRLEAFLALTESEEIILKNFYIFCKYSINNLIGFINELYETRKVPEKDANVDVEGLKKFKEVGIKFKKMGKGTVLSCIRDKNAYDKLVLILTNEEYLIDLALTDSQDLKNLINNAIDTEKYIEYFESKLFYKLNFDESDPYIYTRKPEPVAASGAELIENFAKNFYIAIKTLADTQMPERKDITRAEIEKSLNLLGEKLTPDQQELMKEYFAKGKTGFKSDSTKVCDTWLRNIGKLKSKKTDEEMRSSLAMPASQAQKFNPEEFLKFILEKFPQLREDLALDQKKEVSPE